MVGTFGGALAARKIIADGKLAGEIRGEVEKADDGVLIIRRIHIDQQLRAPEKDRPTAERVMKVYANNCPLYRSVGTSIEVTSSLSFIPEDEDAPPGSDGSSG